MFRPCLIFRPPAPSSDLPSLKTSTPSSDHGLVRRWGRPVLRPGRLEDGAQHIQAIETRLQQILLQTEEYIMENTKKSQLGTLLQHKV